MGHVDDELKVWIIIETRKFAQASNLGEKLNKWHQGEALQMKHSRKKYFISV